MNSPALIKSITERTSVKKVVNGGDIINGFGTEGDEKGLEHYSFWLDRMTWCHDMIFIKGNHDCLVNVDGSLLTTEGYYGLVGMNENKYNNSTYTHYSFKN